VPAIVTVGAQLMARALVTKLRIPDTAAQTRKSPVARSGRAEASCHDISNTWLAHGYSSSSLTTPASQSDLQQPICEHRSKRHRLPWQEIRAVRYSPMTPPPEWPDGVRPILIEGVSLFGISPGTPQTQPGHFFVRRRLRTLAPPSITSRFASHGSSSSEAGVLFLRP